MKIAMIDIGMGNLRSVENAVRRHGVDVWRAATVEALSGADAYILPGVGAFCEAMRRLSATGLDRALTRDVVGAGRPFLGICLGMQLIARHSDERGGADGLGWLDGRWVRLTGGPNCPVPHVGWNEVKVTKSSPLFTGLADGVHFYFDHSYRYVDGSADSIAELDYAGEQVVSAIQRGNISAVQFHPERSQRAGATLLANFLDMHRRRQAA